MNTPIAIWIGLAVGSTVGSLIGSLFSPGIFSFTGIVCEAVGGIIGIWIAFKLTHE